MTKRAWYARTTWSADDREDFLARLRQVAGEHEQVACLRKQAGHLLKARSPEALAGARELYELLIAQFPLSSDLAYAHAALGQCRELLGETDGALAEYVRALDAQRGRARTTTAHLRFGLLAIASSRTDLYEVAARLIAEFAQALIYPSEQYEQCAIRAVLADHRGEAPLARLCALDAIQASKHCAVDPASALHQRVLALAGPAVRPPRGSA